MAFVTNMDSEDQNNQAQGVVAPGGATNTVKTTPSSGVGGAGTVSQAGTAGSPTAGGQFASLNQYVNANQGTAQGLANNVTQGIGNQYNTLQGQNQQTLSGIQNQVNSGYTPQNQDVLSQEAANPVSFASNPSNIQSFQGQANDKYTGPTSAESNANYQTQLANVNNAITTGKQQTGSDAGRQQLLAQTEATPNAGVTGLNSAILSQDPNAQGKIEQAYQPFNNLVTGLSSGAQGIDTSIEQAQTQAQNASNAANAQITGQVGTLNSSINNTVANDTAAQSAYNQQLQQYSNQWAPLSTDINAYNEDIAKFNTAIGNNPANPLTNTGTPYTNPFASTLSQAPSNNSYTPQNVATADQYAQGTAFNNLINGLNTPVPQAIVSGTPGGPALQAPPTFTAPNVTGNQIWEGVANASDFPHIWNNAINTAYQPSYNDVNNIYSELMKNFNQTSFY